MFWGQIAITGMPKWRDAEGICTFADSERHFGHVVYAGQWEAFDAIHPNEAGNGFRRLGTFPTISSAKMAVERAVLPSVAVTQTCAGSGMWVS